MSLQKLKGLTVFQQRKAAAILGALVADAASEQAKILGGKVL